MMTLTVEIDQEKDLPVLQALLDRLDLKYHVDSEDYLPGELELKSINAGLADIEAGKIHTHEQARYRIEQKIAQLRNG